MTMQNSALVPEIIIDTWPEQRLPQGEIKAALTYLAYKTGKQIRFRQYEGKPDYGSDTVMFYVPTRRTPSPSRPLPAITIDGKKSLLSENQPAFSLPTFEPEHVLADDTELPLAVVHYNCIISSIEFTGEDNETARTILAHIVEKATELLDFSVSHLTEERKERLLCEYVQCFRTAIQRRITEKEREETVLKADAQQAYYTIIEAERKLPLVTEELASLKKLAKRLPLRLAQQQVSSLVGLQDSGLYEEISLRESGSICANTTPITVEYDGYRFPLGPYHIDIDSRGDISMRNLTEHSRASNPHPHVDTSGKPCLGNVGADLAKMIGRMQIAEALQVIHQFLSSYNPDNPFEKIGRFDPTGEYDDDEDPCEDCDERSGPYCINECSHNDGYFGCGDCYEYRTEYCFTECSYNTDYERQHPCEGCDRHGSEYCYLECSYNRKWQLQNPCEDCEDEECQSCPYHTKKLKLEGREIRT